MRAKFDALTRMQSSSEPYSLTTKEAIAGCGVLRGGDPAGPGHTAGAAACGFPATAHLARVAVRRAVPTGVPTAVCEL